MFRHTKLLDFFVQFSPASWTMLYPMCETLNLYARGHCMEAGEDRAGWESWRGLWLTLTLLLGGCATSRGPIERALQRQDPPPAQAVQFAEAYTVNCPDVLAIEVETRPELSGHREVGPDGRIQLGTLGRLRVEGQTVAEVSRRLADAVDVSAAWVRVEVADYQSQHLYLLGQVMGQQRVVPYQGPETVLDLLRRIGGITPGAAPDEVYVIRAHIAEGQPPQVFRVDLHAILFNQDQRTNIELQPQDQILVGESSQFSLVKCIPPWLRPLYEAVCGIRR